MSSVLLTAKGLNTFVNQLGEVPQGSLYQADNVVIARDGIIEPARGFKVYGNSMSSVAKQLSVYKNRIIRHFASSLQWDNGNGSFTAFSGSFSETEAGLRIKSIEMNGNYYVTTSNGIKKISAESSSTLGSADITDSGGVKALDFKLSLTSPNSPGFLPQDAVVAYRHLWGKKDKNNNLILGVPSQREVISNSLQTLLSSDFNNLLTALDTAAALSPTDDLHDTDYNTLTLSGSASAFDIKSNLIALTTKLDSDLGVGLKEKIQVACVADVSGSLNNKFFIFYSAKNENLFYIWFNVNSAGVDPNLSGATGIEVAIATGSTASAVATAVRAKFLYSPLSDHFTESGSSANVIFECKNAGTTILASDGGSGVGFTFTEQTKGSDGFSSERSALEELTISSPVTSGQLTSLQSQYDLIVDQLNSYIGFTISNISVAVSTVITSTAHGLSTGSSVVITGSNSTPSVDGTHTVTVIDANSFSIPVTVTVAGTSGTWSFSHPQITSQAAGFDNSTQSSTVDLEITIPEAIDETYFYQVYRTAAVQSTGVSVLSDTDPGDEMGLIYEANPTTLEISQGYLNFTDIVPEDFRGANLYTNPNSGETIAQANEIPPKAKDIALYKNYLFYANTETRYRKQTSLLSVVELVAGTSTISISDGTTTNTYTFDTTEDVSTKKVLISTLPTPAQQVDETARSLVHVINRNDDELVYAFYLSGTSDVPGKLLFESRTNSSNKFYINVNNSTTGSQFSPAIPASPDTSYSADNEVSPNRIYYSKQYQPEAVPLTNYFDVGPKDKKIKRILALRESLFVFKEDAIYRISGESGPFVQNLFDSSALITAPDSADILNNQIYVLTTQGLARVYDGGVEILSRPIENLLVKLNTPAYVNYKTASFGKAYESDRTFYLWTVTNKNDTYATQCFTFNVFTNAWCRRPISKTCAVVYPGDDKLYLGASDINFLEEERKDFTRTDYANREYDQNLSSDAVSGVSIKLPSAVNVNVGDVLLQTQYLTIAQFNRLLSKLDSDNGVTDNDYYILSANPGDNLRNKLTTLAVKLDSDAGLNDTNYASSISSFTSSFSDTQDAFNVIVDKLNADIGALFSNYPNSEGTILLEAPILTVNKVTSVVTVKFSLPFIQGLVTTFEHMKTEWQWSPQTFGNPTTLKQVASGTLLFDKITFSTLNLSFASDLSPGFEPVTFVGSGNGTFGNNVYGTDNYGGMANSTPFRTYVPRNKQRCRYLNCKVTHSVAREAYAVYGLSLNDTTTSDRAYK